MDLIELAFERMGKKGGKKKAAPSNERQRPRLSRSAAEEDPCFELGTPVEVYFNADIEEGKFKAVVDFIYANDARRILQTPPILQTSSVSKPASTSSRNRKDPKR